MGYPVHDPGGNGVELGQAVEQQQAAQRQPKDELSEVGTEVHVDNPNCSL